MENVNIINTNQNWANMYVGTLIVITSVYQVRMTTVVLILRKERINHEQRNYDRKIGKRARD